MVENGDDMVEFGYGIVEFRYARVGLIQIIVVFDNLGILLKFW